MLRITPLRVTALLIAILAIGIIKVLWLTGAGSPQSDALTFEACAAQGYPILESYPRRCRFPDGTMITETVTASSSSSAEAQSSSAEYAPVRVYFGNSVRDPQVLDCSVTFAADRAITEGTVDAKAALEELLKGPTAEEKAQGFFTSIPTGVTLRSLAIVDGVATAEFDAELEQGVGGSCRVTAIRSQITSTLKQFSQVRDVVISVDGRVEGVL